MFEAFPRLQKRQVPWPRKGEISLDIIGLRWLVVCYAQRQHLPLPHACANIMISVHCRRRKIRCLLAPDDPQSRCSNCIRLKKECNFFPVDQQPPLDRRPRTGSKAEGRSGDTSASSSSSPSMTTGHPMDHVDQFNQYPMLPISAHPYGAPSTALGVVLYPHQEAQVSSDCRIPSTFSQLTSSGSYGYSV